MTDTTEKPVIGEKEGKKNAPKPENLRQKILGLPWHVLAFVTYPLLSLTVGNSVSFIEHGLMPLFWTGLGAMCVFAVLSLVLRSFLKAGIIVSLLNVGYFVYGSSRIPDMVLGETELYATAQYVSPFLVNNLFSWIVLSCIVLSSLVLFFVKRNTIRATTTFLNLCALFMLVFGTYSMVTNEISVARFKGEIEKKRLAEKERIRELVGQSKKNRADDADVRYPDIYVIIPDGFAGNVSTYDTPNKIDTFIEALEERGFKVPRLAMSNYATTVFSITSTTNMEYWEELLTAIPYKQDDVFTARSKEERDNIKTLLYGTKRIETFLREKGYDIPVEITSQFIVPPEADIARAVEKNPEFFAAIKMQEHRTKAERVLGFWEMLKRIPTEKSESPRFVYAHFLSPHIPCIFDQHGNYQSNVKYTVERNFLTKKLTEIVDSILAHSERDPVIIIVSDHGWSVPGSKHIDEIPSSDLQVRVKRLCNFIAVRLPKNIPNEMPERVTNVNIFRYVLNSIFDTELPILEDRFFLRLPKNAHGDEHWGFQKSTPTIKELLDAIEKDLDRRDQESRVMDE